MKEEPVKTCLEILLGYILRQDKSISETWKYGMPFYCYNGKMICYLWIYKKYPMLYLGIVEGKQIDHPALITEKGARLKILLIYSHKDVLVKKLIQIMKQVLVLYK